MDASEFTKFFHHVLDVEIPETNRKRIKEYWARFRCQPILFLSDGDFREFDRQAAKSFPYAGVKRGFCLCEFAFRLTFFSDAPPDLLRTLIQHELIHVDQNADITVEDLMRRHLRSDHMPRHKDFIGDAIARARDIEFVWITEALVKLINETWGGDEDELRRWIKAKEAR